LRSRRSPRRSARRDCLASRPAAGQEIPDVAGRTEDDDGDGDGRLRFYCHLDWHELFAPRCKHCTTPIIGEHVVALGAHWHYGHFSCAECGDAFGRGESHVEETLDTRSRCDILAELIFGPFEAERGEKSTPGTASGPVYGPTLCARAC
jgi:hypothetical protein